MLQLPSHVYHANEGAVDDLEIRGRDVQALAASFEALLDIAILDDDYRLVLSRHRSFDMYVHLRPIK